MYSAILTYFRYNTIFVRRKQNDAARPQHDE